MKFITEKAKDGFFKVTIPSLEMVTWAKDEQDAETAVIEAVESLRIQTERFGNEEDKRFLVGKICMKTLL